MTAQPLSPGSGRFGRRSLFGRAGTLGLAVTGGVLATSLPGLLAAPAAQASSLNGVIGRQEIIDRGWRRYHQRPRYSWTSQTEGFRNDCSGFVSYAWNTLPQGNNGWTTYSLPQITHRISAAELRAGDILLWVGNQAEQTGHVQLFLGWTDAARSRFQVLEHGGGNSGVEPPEFNTYSAIRAGYYPARYNKVNELDPYGTIRVKWLATGGASSPVGNPTLPELDAKRGGRFQQFQNGMIIWNRANNQAWMVYGAILTKYRDTGSEQAWGFPTQDEFDASASPTGSKGRFQKFENALILWSAQTDVHLLHGEIRKYFENNDYEKRFGYPTSDEIPEGSGFKQTFELGTIHWNPTSGATWEAKA
ncbi:NlpC/P60 family protein [Nakamurella aerolata]|uniref:NlpC/P60 domain-containing protein n=1 Tax=Nakamurella aerolata TaxID=1656892 RepID=A0A849A4E7_9ACTN|nr:NlpC/P60 family protein [Nakamurella aerolata]NNG34937.1 hypothetical protein [Nakamurella aerolata]